jgi:hypothetical protein
MDPRSARFHLSEAFHQWDFLLFSVVGAAIFPCYIVWLFLNYADFALSILIAMQFGLLLADIVLLAISALVIQRPVFLRNLPYLLGYSTFTTYCMRIVRLCAYIEELLFFGSRRDNYVPLKVRSLRPW